MLTVVLYSASSLFRLSSFVSRVFMPLIGTLLGTLVEVHFDPSVPTLLCGDFNAVFDCLLNRVGSDPFDTACESSVVLSRLFSSCCVFDIWRYLHPSSNSFTWSRWNGLVSSRVDLFGVPFSWVSSVAACDILPFPFSVSVSVPDAITSGPGLWKLNLSVLDDPEYVSHFWFLVFLAHENP